MIKKIIAAIAVAGSLIGLVACHHHHGRHCWGPSPEEKADWIIKKAGKKLDLNNTQKEALRSVADEMIAFKKEMHKDHDQLHQEMFAMITAEELDSDRILEIVDDKQKVFDEKIPVIIDKLAILHKTLSPEQKQKIAKKMEKHVSDCDEK